MAAAQRRQTDTAFRSSVTEFATPALPVSPPARHPGQRHVRTRDINPATAVRHRAQTRKMLAMIAAASTVVACGVAFLWGQASVTSEGYRHSQLTKMLNQEHELEQQWKHEQAQLYTQSNIEQKAQESGMIKAPVEDTVTAGVLHASPAVAANEYSSPR